MHEFNPLNEQLKKQYEEALIHGDYRSSKTVDKVWKAINLFENFIEKKDFTSFNKNQAIGFKRWLCKQEGSKGELLGISTVSSTLANVRAFFKWLAVHPKCVRKVDGTAVSYLRLSDNEERAGRASKEPTPPTVEEVHKVLEHMPSDTDIEKRDRAIIAFTCLTCVRIEAIISLKIKDIDIKKKQVWQDPKHVRTKNRKGITTTFMPFDPIWEPIFLDWYEHAISVLGFEENDPLFPKQLVISNPETMSFEVNGLSKEHLATAGPIRDIFRSAFTGSGLPYFHPHLFRKMISIWGIENCNQMQMKAISQNIGHEHIMTTYNSYGTLNGYDQRKSILSIKEGNKDLNDVSYDELLKELGRRKA